MAMVDSNHDAPLLLDGTVMAVAGPSSLYQLVNETVMRVMCWDERVFIVSGPLRLLAHQMLRRVLSPDSRKMFAFMPSLPNFRLP